MVNIFDEITSLTNNVGNNQETEKAKESNIGVSIQVPGSLSSNHNLSKDSDSDEDDSLFSRGSETETMNNSSTEEEWSADSMSSFSGTSKSSDDDTWLSYTSRKLSGVIDADKIYLNEVKRRTKKAEMEYRDSEERRLKSIHLIACRHLRNGNLKVAQQKFEEILTTLVEDYGEKHERVGGALHNLGIVHLRAGNLREAKDAIKAAIRIRMKELGEFHPKVADSLVELAIVLIHHRKYEKAIDFFCEALSIRECHMEDVDEDDDIKRSQIKLQMAKIHNDIGCTYFEMGTMDEAKVSFQSALDIQRKIYGDDIDKNLAGQLAMSSTICNLGFAHLENAKWESAWKTLEYALKIQKRFLDGTNPLLLNTMEALGYVNVKVGRYDDALKVYKEIVRVKKSAYEVAVLSCEVDMGDLEIAEAMKNIVYCQAKLYKYQDAIETLREIEAIQEMNYDDNDKRLEFTRRLISSAHYDLYKHPGPFELFAMKLTLFGFRDPFNRDLLCKCVADVESSDFLPCKPTPPPIKTKLAGHKISYA